MRSLGAHATRAQSQAPGAGMARPHEFSAHAAFFLGGLPCFLGAGMTLRRCNGPARGILLPTAKEPKWLSDAWRGLV